MENRIKILESKVSYLSDNEDEVLMDALYKKAEELVKKHKKSSIIFLQRKLLIDMPRAKRIITELKRNGVIV